MKKIFTLLAVTMMFTSANAQTKNNYSIGVRAGVNTSAFGYFPLDDPRFGMNAGISGVYSKWENHGIGADLLFSRTGGEYYLGEQEGRISRYDAYTDYIRIQPKYYYFFNDLEDKFRPKVSAGVSVGFLTGAEADNMTGTRVSSFNSVDAGGILGAGFNYTVSKAIWLSVDVEYLLSATQANKIEVYQPDNLYTNNLSLNVGINFGLTQLDGK